MKHGIVDIAGIITLPTPCELSRDEELAIVTQYKGERTSEVLEAEYHDIDKQLAESVPAEVLLRELGIEHIAE